MGHASILDVITMGLIVAVLLGAIIYNVANIRYGKCKDCGVQVGEAENECGDCYAERCGYPRTGDGRIRTQADDASAAPSIKATELASDI